jgi:hypothetical protein
LLAFAADAGAFAALGGQHAGVAGVGITPAQAGLQLAGQRHKKVDCNGPVHVCVDGEDEKLVCPLCDRTSFVEPAFYSSNDFILCSGPVLPLKR